eukprot:CAMPEP_0196254248 /NCGR_PEP_ID=MMETSP0913-20130531/53500_1 /TAXON_ID=49265 /ORGANISM="Thalassiosira rotula, Strain GSO102" /LENGTH=42 /DNA_ID= /DNA_START= /DNA_END= /DNA_ORIENTATION=
MPNVPTPHDSLSTASFARTCDIRGNDEDVRHFEYTCRKTKTK